MKIYKHIPAQYADGFADGSSVLVGTLSDFRNQESHQEGIGDCFDATFLRVLNWGGDLVPGSVPARKIAQAGLINAAPAGVTIPNVFIEDTVIGDVARDCYVLCTAVTATAPLGYDKVVEIADAAVACEVISTALIRAGHAGRRYGKREVEYRDIQVDFMKTEVGQAHPFLKDASFRHQVEYRMAFEPASFPIKPQVVSVNWPAGLIGPVVDWAPAAPSQTPPEHG